MFISYDTIDKAFLSKITEYVLSQLEIGTARDMVDSYMKRTIPSFNRVCVYDLSTYDDKSRMIMTDIDDDDADEIVDIISEGMVLQWMKPYLYQQDLYENLLNTKDFTTYSSAELLKQVGNAYERVQRDYTQMIREYSYNHGDLTKLHI